MIVVRRPVVSDLRQRNLSTFVGRFDHCESRVDVMKLTLRTCRQQDRTGQDRAGQDRTDTAGQGRAGQSRRWRSRRENTVSTFSGSVTHDGERSSTGRCSDSQSRQSFSSSLPYFISSPATLTHQKDTSRTHTQLKMCRDERADALAAACSHAACSMRRQLHAHAAGRGFAAGPHAAQGVTQQQ
jgi:hypothetical protein